MTNFLAFDLEIVKEIPPNVDWKTIRPLGISCAATVLSGEAPRAWRSGAGAMTIFDLNILVDYLMDQSAQGAKIVTWNGLSFDFDILAEESGRYMDCKALALNHYDMMFQFLCVKGYPIGMQTAAIGLHLQGKTEGMSGVMAPVLWAGSDDDRALVLEYVKQDAFTTLQIASRLKLNGGLVTWTSKTGKYNATRIGKLLTVKESMDIPHPDTSWMNKPITREKLAEWTHYLD